MKKLITSNSGGHLLSLDDFRHTQEGNLESLQAIVRSLIPNIDYCILYGCQLTVSGADFSLSAGYVFIGGEIFQVDTQAGTNNGTGLYYVIYEEFAPFNPVKYETGDDYNVHVIRKARVVNGDELSSYGSGFVAAGELKPISQLLTPQLDMQAIRDAVFEVGDIRIFTGNLPTYFEESGLGKTGTKYAKWAIANGGNGTVNLSGRVLVGLQSNDNDFNAVGKTGGAKTVTLNVSEMPAHSHTGLTQNGGGHSHTYDGIGINQGTDYDSGGGNADYKQSKQTSSDPGHQHGFQTNPVGGGAAHQNMPPYMVTAYIQKITA